MSTFRKVPCFKSLFFYSKDVSEYLKERKHTEEIPSWAAGNADSTDDENFESGTWHDGLVGFIIVCVPAAYAVAILVGDLMRLYTQFYRQKMTALALSRFANSLSEMACLLLVFLIWLTFCYFHETDFQVETSDIDRRRSSRVLEPFNESLLDQLATQDSTGSHKNLIPPNKWDHRHRVRNFFSYSHADGKGGVMSWFGSWVCGRNKKNAPTDAEEPPDADTNEKEEVVSNVLHQFWSKSLLGQGLQPGGFAPRFTALSMGFLLFIGGTIVKTDTMAKGEDITLHKMMGYDGCRAMASDVATPFWFSRFWRSPPVGCLGVQPQYAFLSYFTSGKTFIVLDGENNVKATELLGDVKAQIGDAEWAVLIWNNKSVTIDCVDSRCPHTVRYDSEKDLNLKNPWQLGGNNALIAAPNILYGKADTNHTCKYQCTKFNSLSLKSMVTLSGTIFTGALFLTKTTEWVSAMLGYGLVTESTSPGEVTRLLTQVQYGRSSDNWQGRVSWLLRRYMRRTACALQLFAVLLVSYRLAPVIAIDGMYTPDYYTALIFVFSALCSVLQRYWNPYWCHPIICTKKMWSGGDGKDHFFDPLTGKQTLDLFQWLHLHPERRSTLLFWYARKVSDDDIDTAKKKKGGRHPVVVCTDDIKCKTTEERQIKTTGGFVPAQCTRTVTIKAGTHGRLIGGAAGKPQVVWFSCISDVLQSDLVQHQDAWGSARLIKISGQQGGRVVEQFNFENFSDNDVAELEKNLVHGGKQIAVGGNDEEDEKTIMTRIKDSILAAHPHSSWALPPSVFWTTSVQWVMHEDEEDNEDPPKKTKDPPKKTKLSLQANVLPILKSRSEALNACPTTGLVEQDFYVGWITDCNTDVIFESGWEWKEAQRVLRLPTLRKMLASKGQTEN